MNVGILGDHATQLFAIAIKGMGHEFGLDINLYESDFDQIDQDVLDLESSLYQHDSEFVILSKSIESLSNQFYNLESSDRSNFAKEQIDHIFSIYETIQNRQASSKLICLNFPLNFDLTSGNFALKSESSFRFQIQKLNYLLGALAVEHGNLFLMDICGIQSSIGYDRRIDQKFYYKSNQVYSLEILPQLSSQIIQIIGAVKGTHLKKCLILDLDNTLWGGVIGDDGLERIQIGDLGMGKAFTELQKWAKDLRQRGIILCVCSKNTEAVAKKAFTDHTDMVLRLDDISVFVANWENKADNIRYIQSILNIGFDSMVFLDDNKFERDLVGQELPQITIPDLPEDPAEYLRYLRNLNLFETASLSKEDVNRTKKYQEEAERGKGKTQYKSIDEYLKQLEMKAVCESFQKISVSRIAQLTQRSNQFNLRTKRYTESQIEKVAKNDSFVSFEVKLKDRFGDYGLICVIVGEIQPEGLFIDTWLMSCRVLKRGVENFVMSQLVVKCKELELDYIIGEYIQTPKNAIVQEHYKKLGFINDEDKSLWFFDIKTSVDFPSYIEKINNNNA